MKNDTTPRTTIANIIQYTPPKLYKGKIWYIGFYAFDPAIGAMKRKRIRINFVEKNKRREYANALINRINSKLLDGWNPWIEAQNGNAYHLWSDVAERYKRFIEKMYSDGVYRDETYASYLSFIRNMDKYNLSLKYPITYVYQLNKKYLVDFIEHIYIDRDNSIQTRNNYVGFVRLFGTWLVQHSYMTTNPAEGIIKLSKRLIKKQRTVIPDDVMDNIKRHLEKNNDIHYLLACYILHYCFIRPKEMSKLKISQFSLKRQTIYIPSEMSKNHKDAVVTLPSAVIRLMLDLNIFIHPGEYYLFSSNFKPGKELKSEKQFRDHWLHYVRKPLRLPAQYKFYSLKDTGITNMLRAFDTISVRDQARHSDILMTDTYTPHDIQEANNLIKDYSGKF